MDSTMILWFQLEDLMQILHDADAMSSKLRIQTHISQTCITALFLSRLCLHDYVRAQWVAAINANHEQQLHRPTVAAWINCCCMGPALLQTEVSFADRDAHDKNSHSRGKLQTETQDRYNNHIKYCYWCRYLYWT